MSARVSGVDPGSGTGTHGRTTVSTPYLPWYYGGYPSSLLSPTMGSRHSSHQYASPTMGSRHSSHRCASLPPWVAGTLLTVVPLFPPKAGGRLHTPVVHPPWQGGYTPLWYTHHGREACMRLMVPSHMVGRHICASGSLFSMVGRLVYAPHGPSLPWLGGWSMRLMVPLP